ncbi:hypothetical protein CAEBREN_07360 [Caenorhabditis brenneri]|uniref:Sdz-33 F-box domain-containing protein n=1 Tax=Caenorhabditis brenneri TaxID=135651 RepID=G0N0F9_CAEBE|nr:hypothetical protein CAEBREN_07360 [Caenorhabditis brenneri]
MAQAPEHPLLSLPDNQIIRKIRKTSLKEILKFSLISKRCKDLVTTAGIEGLAFYVFIGNKITIMIKTCRNIIELGFYTEPDMYWGIGANGRKKRLTPPQSITVQRPLGPTETITFESMKKDGTMKDWLKHFQIVFNHVKIDKIQFSENSSEFDIDDIKAVFGIPTEMEIGNTGCFAFNQMILQKFFPIKDLGIKTESFQDSKIPPSLLMQNFDALNIQRDSNAPKNITLDELLLINSKVITVDSLHISPKELNKFIQLWQRGANPRMEYFRIDNFKNQQDDENNIMKGIKKVNPLDRVRIFESGRFESPVSGGTNISRMDGVIATIRHWEGHSILEMYVWFDHCLC